MDQGDHTWKFKFCDTGCMHAMLQWKLHKAVKATVTSGMNMKDIPAGKIEKLPLGLNFEI